MAASTPTKEPTEIRAGDTVAWTKNVSDYKASDGWTLKYSYRRRGGEGTAIEIESTADGDKHSIDLATTDTDKYIVGTYDGVSFVTNGDGEKHTIEALLLEVLPNLSDEPSTFDPRTKAQRIIDFIERSWERVMAKQTVSANIEGTSLVFRSVDDLIKARDYWKPQAIADDAAAQGGSTGRLILHRFTRPT